MTNKGCEFEIERYRIEQEPFYVESQGEVGLFATAAQNRMPVMLKGPTGCGKTRFVQHMAYRLGRPLITVACHEDLTASDLVGRYLLRGQETVWMDGPLTLGVKHGAIVYLDEIVEARKDTTVIIHPLTDDRRLLPIEKKGQIVEAVDDFLLVISYNPGYQSVLKDLKQSTKQRFVAIEFTYPAPGIETRIIPGYLPPRDPEWGYLRMGYGECFDSFFAFGLFALAKQSGYFPAELVRVFEPVIQEEARHIVFFVNWVAWCRANRAPWRRPAHAWRCASALSRQAWRRVRTAKSVGGGAEGKDFTFESHKNFSIDLSPRSFFALCLAENARRMAGYDPRLLRPRFMPTAIGLLCRALPAGKKA